MNPVPSLGSPADAGVADIASAPAASPAPAVPRALALSVLVPGALVAAIAILASRVIHDTAVLRVLDNVHWTVGYATGAVLAWLGVHYAPEDVRASRRWFAWGLTAYAAGQVFWDAQVAFGWNPFPGPSDLLFLMVGPFCAAGCLVSLRRHAAQAEQKVAALDVGVLSVAGLVVVLSLYLPFRGHNSVLQMAVLAAYPLGMISAACIAIVMIPTLRLRPHADWLVFLAGLVLNSGLWMEWNALTLSGGLRDGTLYNATFSVIAIAMGIGAMRWRPVLSSNVRWERRAEGALRLMPLLVVVGTAGAVFAAFTLPNVPITVRGSTGIGALVVVTLALLRQNVLLHERDRMLAAELRFRALFNCGQDAIMFLGEERFLDCNPSAERMFGLSREELCKRSPVDVSPQLQHDGRPSAVAAAERIAAAMRGESQSFRWRHSRPDGSTFEAEVSLDPVDLPDGRITQAFVRDVTERVEGEETRRRLEEQLRHSARLEAVGRLAGGVAHDFNNLLTVIMGTTEMALLRCESNPRMEKDLREIRSSAQRAAGLTSQLLAFSRKQVIAPVPSDINGIVRGALVMLRRLIGEDVDLRFEPGAEVGTILVDPTQLEQVLINLAVNARDAMPTGGRLDIATSLVEIGDVPVRGQEDVRAGRYARLVVSDTGPGIPADIVDHVFEPFFTTKQFGRGTGLGLSTVYGIVRQGGGFVTLSSPPGEGARFEIHFPVVNSVPVQSTPAPAARRSEKGETILVVEDEGNVRALVCRVLRNLGYHVEEAGSGAEAIRRVEAGLMHIDLLLTDVIMPGMSGRQVYEALAARMPGLRVVYMSGYTDNIVAPHGVLEPDTHFVQKPFTQEMLGSVVREALERRTAA